MNRSPFRAAPVRLIVTAGLAAAGLLLAGCGDSAFPTPPVTTGSRPAATAGDSADAESLEDLETTVSEAEAQLKALDQDFRGDDTP